MLTFQRFETLAEAREAMQWLATAGIPAEIENVQGPLDSNFVGKDYSNNVFLKIPQEEFTRARQILIDHTPVDINAVDKDYMLFSLSNEELEDVLAKPDEWGAYNYNLAKAILQQRNITVDSENIAQLREEHIQQMASPKTISSFWLGITYLLVAAAFINLLLPVTSWIFYFMLASVYCAVWGWAVGHSKKTLPDGNRIFTYDASSRRHGNIVFASGLIAFILNFALPMYLHTVGN